MTTHREISAHQRANRPEDVLANTEVRLSVPIEDMLRRTRIRPCVDFSQFSVPGRISAALEHNRRALADLPDQTEMQRLADIAREALMKSTPTVVTREIAQLVGSFPNANLPNPEIFLSAAVFDVLDRRLPDSVVVLACRKLRRSRRFVPAISEILEMADDILSTWRAVEEAATELPAIRATLIEAVQRSERVLAAVQSEIADGYRDAGGRILRRRPTTTPTHGALQ